MSTRAITPALLRRWPLPRLDDRLGKVARGSVLVVGGSDEIPGAAILAALASLRAGAGTIVIATTARVAPHVAVTVPEARVIGLRTTTGELAPTSTRALAQEIERSDGILVGPGMRDGRAAAEVIRSAGTATTVVLDAGAIDGLGAVPRKQRAARLVITPHVGEMARLLAVAADEVMAQPQALAMQAARELGLVVVLKGKTTYIAAPDGSCFTNAAGNLGLGTSGSGDTLSGVIAGLSARGADPVQAAAWGVYAHARAGELLARSIAPLGYLARELLAEIPGVVAALSKPRRR